MEYNYEATEGTEAYELIHKLFHYTDKWHENQEAIEAFLGFPMVGNLIVDEKRLTVDLGMLKKHRPEWMTNFKKNTSPAEAKIHSQVNKQWIALVKELGLFSVSNFEISLALELYATPKHTRGSYGRLGERFFYSSDNELPEESIAKGLALMSEAQYLRARADLLDEEAKNNE